MAAYSFSSPAKLNLVLDLLRKRDDGYHEVEFVMQELKIHDTIQIEPVPANTDIVLSCTDPMVPLNEKNTCYKAVQLMQEEARMRGKKIEGARIHIEKKIPSAGGLGGGSSNAAAVLKGLNQLWSLNLPKEKLAEIAGKIGSDVPFFIYGGTCIATGRGELILPIQKCPVLHLAFIVPPIKVPADKTRWIYSHFDVARVPEHPSIDAMEDAIRKKDSVAVAQAMGNVFEYLDLPAYAPAFAIIEGVQPLLGVWKSMLAGAGPTICVVCDSQKTASQLIEPFRAKGWTAFATRTV